jgi:RHS repeat-associated protein
MRAFELARRFMVLAGSFLLVLLSGQVAVLGATSMRGDADTVQPHLLGSAIVVRVSAGLARKINPMPFTPCTASITTLMPCDTTINQIPNATGQTQTINIRNSSSTGATYVLSCTHTGVIASCSVVHSQFVAGNHTVGVPVTYATGSTIGTGTLGMKAIEGSSGDNVTTTTTVNVPPAAVVSVTPDATPVSVNPSAVDTQMFTVRNSGSSNVTFTLVATCTGTATACIAPATILVNHFSFSNVLVTYNASVNDTGTVKLKATFTTVSDTGWVSVTTRPWASVSTAFNNNDAQKLGMCENNCFSARAEYITTPYYSLGAPQSIAINYDGDRVAVRPVVYADVTLLPQATKPNEYWLQLQDSTGAYVPFLNGDATKIRFSGATNSPIRLAGQFNAGAYSTGLYSFTLTITSVYSGRNEVSTQPLKILIVNDRKSSVARGWTVIGLSRLYVQGTTGVVTTGDGSAIAFSGLINARGPAGEYSVLSSRTGGYIWLTPDSTRTWFRSNGLADSIADRFGTTVRFTYDASNRLIRVTDPIRLTALGQPVYTQLNYGTYGLQSIVETKAQNGIGQDGRTTLFAVAADSTLRTITDVDGITSSYSYDAQRRLSSITNRRGAVTSFTYAPDSSWRISRIALPQIPVDNGADGTTLQIPTINLFAWQRVGVPSSSTGGTAATAVRADTVRASLIDARGDTTSYTVDRWGQPLQIKQSYGRTSTIVRSGPFAILSIRPSGASDTASYNADGLLTYTRAAGKDGTSITYGAYGQPTYIETSPRPGITNYIGIGGRVDSTRVYGALSKYQYDSHGLLTQTTDPATHVTKRFYDSWGNEDSTSFPGGQWSARRADQYGRDSIVLASSKRPDTTFYDLMNRPTRIARSGNGLSIRLKYDSLYLVRIQDSKNAIYRTEYNAQGMRTRQYDPADTVNRYISYRYDVDGDMTSATNRRGQAIHYTYDALHRRVSKSGTRASSDNFGYDPFDRVFASWNSVTRDSIFFSPTGWTDSAVTIVGGKRFRRLYLPTSMQLLDSLAVSTTAPVTLAAQKFFWSPYTGMLDSTRVSGRTIGYQRNAAQFLTLVKLPIGGTEALTYGSNHQPTTSSFSAHTLDTAFARSYGYDSTTRVTSLWNPHSGATRGFTYDGLDRLQRERFWADTTQCGPPDDNGYVSCSTTSVPLQIFGFEFDSASNVSKETDSTHATSTSATYAPGNRENTWGANTYTYDLDGNRIGLSSTARNASYRWTSDGEMDTVIVGSTKLAYAYDPNGHLVRRARNGTIDRYFIWDGNRLLAEFDGAMTTRIANYSYGPDEYGKLDAPLTIAAGSDSLGVRLFVHNALGNTIGLVSTNGTISQRFDYRPWGDTVSSIPGVIADTNRLRWKYSLWESDSTKLYLMGARWYDPISRQFMSEDPIGVQGGINLYSFAENDPINHADPSGLDDNYDGDFYDDSYLNSFDYSDLGLNLNSLGLGGPDGQLTTTTLGIDYIYGIGPDFSWARIDPGLFFAAVQSIPGSMGLSGSDAARKPKQGQGQRDCTADAIQGAKDGAVDGAIVGAVTGAVVGGVAGFTAGAVTGGTAGVILGGLLGAPLGIGAFATAAAGGAVGGVTGGVLLGAATGLATAVYGAQVGAITGLTTGFINGALSCLRSQ